MQWRKTVVTAAIAALALASIGPASLRAATEPRKPNIVVILADDLGYADISAYGIKRINTPNLDSIGNQGIKFTDAYATAPVCGPSRADPRPYRDALA